MSDPLEETFRQLGLSPGAARVAANGRGGPASADPYERAVAQHRELGLSEAAARAAVRGRDHATDEAAARALRAAHRPAEDGRSMPERNAARLRECRLELDAARLSGDRERVREATAAARRVLAEVGGPSSPSASSPGSRETATYMRLREAGASPAEAAREASLERWGR